MCERLILDGDAYICDSCWDELLEAKETWPKQMVEVDVRDAIERFMRSAPGSLRIVETDAAFARLTGSDSKED